MTKDKKFKLYTSPHKPTLTRGVTTYSETMKISEDVEKKLESLPPEERSEYLEQIYEE